MNAKQVGERVKFFRERKGIKKNALANLAGISPTYINDIESGRKCPTVEVLGYICTYGLDITLAEFFDTQLFANKDYVASLTENQRNLLNEFLKSL